MPSFKNTSSSLHRFTSNIIGGKTEEKIKMPGKSNKFDYTNRPNSGAKLGEIIASSLQKEAEKVKKDAERLAAKARKQSGDSSSGVYDASSTQHVIDLKAPSKALGDAGVCAMADGMEIALRSGTSTASLALEDLNLSNNALTTLSLARLAAVVKLAKYELKTINLSGNNIRVVDDEQAQQWEAFLVSFAGCMKLRRLDLSDNPHLDSRAMEIFARVHVSERPVTPIPPGGIGSVLSLLSDVGEDQASERDQADSVTDFDLSKGISPLTRGTVLRRMCGLRSIPYITFHNIGLTDAGALWLSYVLEDHYYPSQLISELNATNAESIVKAYQQNTHSRGVDWTENKSLDKDGKQLLEKTESIRERRLHDDTAADMLDIEEGDGSDSNVGHGRRASIDRLHLHAQPRNRRGSMRSIRTADGGEHEVSELESARKKIMRQIIVHDKASSIELWQSSIAVFNASRQIRFLVPEARKCYTREPLFATEAPAPPTIPSPTPLASPTQASHTGLTIDADKANSANPSVRASYASKLLSANAVAGERELALTDVTNTPSTPLRLQKPTHRKGAFSEGTDVVGVTGKLGALVVRDHSPLRLVKFQQRRIERKAAEGKIYRDRSTPTQLPADVMQHLVSYAVGERAMNVCQGEQRWRAIERGQDKATLKAEMGWLKKDKSAQVLMLLDSIQCLHYGQ